MKGDIIILEEHHRKAARSIVAKIAERIENTPTRYAIAVSGESGSGKSETGKAIADELDAYGIKSVLLGQDDYFVLPPKANDAKRRVDPDWLGPHAEVKMGVLEQNIIDARKGTTRIAKPLVDYDEDSVEEEKISLEGIKVVIVEGTYAALLKHIDTRIFIARNRMDTLEHRQKRNRGKEVGDPFIEQVLATEHKIIAGHRQLADFIITKEYDVIEVD
ncbi:MAG: zeta toxin family protein [Spirochaetaceae bacterium]|nr:zeta toxin family protein [Spirochaetaceae bacterium]